MRHKAGPKRSKDERLRDDVIIANLHLRGKTQEQIASHLNKRFYLDRPLSRQAIGQALARIRKEWLRKTLRQFSKAKAEELAQLDNLEAELWRAWDDSRRPIVTTREKRAHVRVVNRQGGTVQLEEPVVVETQTQERTSAGDPRFLAEINRCIHRRCRLLGLDTPHLIQVSEKEIEMLSDVFSGLLNRFVPIHDRRAALAEFHSEIDSKRWLM